MTALAWSTRRPERVRRRHDHGMIMAGDHAKGCLTTSCFDRSGVAMPVLEREEYIEQAYFFHAFRERLLDGLPAQDILARIGEELLSTTRLPLAVSFLYTDIKGSGLLAPAMARIGHYFTPFQAHVVEQ